jgi:hypothetical protein
MAAGDTVFQVFGMDVPYVAITIYACCICMFSSVSGVFRLLFQVFQTYVANVSSGCFKSRSWCCTRCKWLYTHVSSVLSVFICMLQMFHLDVSKVDRVLHCCNGASG